MNVSKYPVLAALAMLQVFCAGVEAEVHVFDFENGPGPMFQIVNTEDLWTIDTDGPTLRISKPEDDLTVNPRTHILGGIESLFSVEGDFTITVDYELFEFPCDISNPSTYNTSALGIWDQVPQVFEVLRYIRGGPCVHRIEAYGPDAPVGPRDAPAEVVWTGRYRVARQNGTMTGSFAPLGSEVFTELGSVSGYAGPVSVFCLAWQTTGNPTRDRANTVLDVAFDNLIIEGTISDLAACCLEAYCVMMAQEDCESYGGSFQGPGTVCEPNPCPTSSVPDGAVVQEKTWGRLRSLYR